jgi:hypothetical protein
MEIYVDDEAKLTLHGLVQHYVMLNEDQKNRKLNDLLDALDFNQVRARCLCFLFFVCGGREGDVVRGGVGCWGGLWAAALPLGCGGGQLGGGPRRRRGPARAHGGWAERSSASRR